MNTASTLAPILNPSDHPTLGSDGKANWAVTFHPPHGKRGKQGGSWTVYIRARTAAGAVSAGYNAPGRPAWAKRGEARPWNESCASFRDMLASGFIRALNAA
jgi:hypothetical protein